MPKLLGSITPHGVLGLLVAGMLAASMSTYSAYLLAWSSFATRDVIDCLRPINFGERRTIWLTRLIAGLIGTFLLVFGLWYQIPDTAFQYLFITGGMYTAGALGCVAAGIYWRRANTIGAYHGSVSARRVSMLEKWRGSLPPWLAFITDVNVSGLLSFILAFSGMVVGSLITQRSYPPAELRPEQTT